jgi:hypothetical protein
LSETNLIQFLIENGPKLERVSEITAIPNDLEGNRNPEDKETEGGSTVRAQSDKPNDSEENGRSKSPEQSSG